MHQSKQPTLVTWFSQGRREDVCSKILRGVCITYSDECIYIYIPLRWYMVMSYTSSSCLSLQGKLEAIMAAIMAG